MNIIKIIAYTIFIFITEKFKGKVPIGPIHQLFQLEPHAKTERYVVTHSIITVGISLFCYEAYINSNEETPISILIVELVKKRDLYYSIVVNPFIQTPPIILLCILKGKNSMYSIMRAPCVVKNENYALCYVKKAMH